MNLFAPTVFTDFLKGQTEPTVYTLQLSGDLWAVCDQPQQKMDTWACLKANA